jgi:hypothetical protein
LFVRTLMSPKKKKAKGAGGGNSNAAEANQFLLEI